MAISHLNHRGSQGEGEQEIRIEKHKEEPEQTIAKKKNKQERVGKNGEAEVRSGEKVGVVESQRYRGMKPSRYWQQSRWRATRKGEENHLKKVGPAKIQRRECKDRVEK